MDGVKRAFDSMLGEYCWKVGYGKYTNLYMSFGEPHLTVVGGPRKTESTDLKDQILAARRVVAIRGKWDLSLGVSYFTILQNTAKLASSSSGRKRIDIAAIYLDGQVLAGFKINYQTGATRLEFDLGGVLEIRRCEASSVDDLWFLYGPTQILSVKGNGTWESEKRAD